MTEPRKMLVAVAAYCIGPMALIVVLTSVLGIAVGWAGALAVGLVAVGLVAAGLCVAIMVQRHQQGHGGVVR